MSNSAISMYALSLDQIENAIRLGGNKRTVLVQGHMGTGKSSLLKSLGKALPKHVMCYFDCTTKDLATSRFLSCRRSTSKAMCVT